MKKFLLFSLFFFLSALGVYAYTSTDVQNATFLADQNIIVKQSVESKYRLDDTITRAEVVGMALKIKGITLPEKYTCRNYFTDVRYNPTNNWICRAIELAADEGIISKTNSRARPQDSITRAETLAVLMEAGNVADLSIEENKDHSSQGDGFFYTRGWQEGIILKAYHRHIIEDVTRNYDSNRPATRGEVFGFARNILDLKNIDQDISYTSFLEKIEEFIVNEYGEDYQINSSSDTDRDIVFGDNSQYTISISFDYDFQQDALGYGLYNSLKVFKLGNYWALKLNNSGMGSKIDIVIPFDDKLIVISSAGDPSIVAQKILPIIPGKQTYSFTPISVLKTYYLFLQPEYRILGGSLSNAYAMRSPSEVTFETFTSWYKNTSDVNLQENTIKDLGDNTYEFLVEMTENGTKSTYKVKSKVDLENFTIDNISSVKQ